ncbi:hypothetical protein O77CONTIG1_02813 [Leptolyngbya sp. O-77]|nr:hypothetical protein O77CONTIG1_02813 [Leptolyngbya sp. O-77]
MVTLNPTVLSEIRQILTLVGLLINLLAVLLAIPGHQP